MVGVIAIIAGRTSRAPVGAAGRRVRLLLALRRRGVGRHVRHHLPAADDALARALRPVRRWSPRGGRGRCSSPPARPARPATTADAGRRAGRELYLTGCSSCHGLDGAGRRRPRRRRRGARRSSDAGEAGARTTMLTTGRMPLADPADNPAARSPAYDRREIAALVAYVASARRRPADPRRRPRRRRPRRGRRAVPGELPGRATARPAPAARSATAGPPRRCARRRPTQVGAAMRTGPGPDAGVRPETLRPTSRSTSIARYVEYLERPRRPGRPRPRPLGPIPEGFVAWVLGIGLAAGGRAPGSAAAAATATTSTEDRAVSDDRTVTDEERDALARRGERLDVARVRREHRRRARPRRRLLAAAASPSSRGCSWRSPLGGHRRRARRVGQATSCPDERGDRGAAPGRVERGGDRGVPRGVRAGRAQPHPAQPARADGRRRRRRARRRPRCSRSARSGPGPGKGFKSTPVPPAACAWSTADGQPVRADGPRRRRRDHRVPRGPHRRRRRADPAHPHRPRPGLQAPAGPGGLDASTASSPTRSSAPTSAARSGSTRPDEHLLLCPCHQSTFDVLDGARPVFGPAARSLPQLPLGIDDDGYLVATRRLLRPGRARLLGPGPLMARGAGSPTAWSRDGPPAGSTRRLGSAKFARTRAQQGLPRPLVVHARRARPLLLRRPGRSPASTSRSSSTRAPTRSSTTAATRRCGASRCPRPTASALDLSFDVRAGLVMRQIHHWAALLFLAADRRAPRPGVLHRRLPPAPRDQLDHRRHAADPRPSSTASPATRCSTTSSRAPACASPTRSPCRSRSSARGSRRCSSAASSPGPTSSTASSSSTSCSCPAIIAVLLGVHLGHRRAPQAHAVRRAGPHARTTSSASGCGRRYAAKALGLFFLTAAVLCAPRRAGPDQPDLALRPVRPGRGERRPRQPDWYMGWLDGALRLMPGVGDPRLRLRDPEPVLPRRAAGRAHLRRCSTPGRSSRRGSPATTPSTTCSTGPATARCAPRSASPTLAFYAVLFLGGVDRRDRRHVRPVGQRGARRRSASLSFVLPPIAGVGHLPAVQGAVGPRRSPDRRPSGSAVRTDAPPGAATSATTSRTDVDRRRDCADALAARSAAAPGLLDEADERRGRAARRRAAAARAPSSRPLATSDGAHADRERPDAGVGKPRLRRSPSAGSRPVVHRDVPAAAASQPQVAADHERRARRRARASRCRPPRRSRTSRRRAITAKNDADADEDAGLDVAAGAVVGVRRRPRSPGRADAVVGHRRSGGRGGAGPTPAGSSGCGGSGVEVVRRAAATWWPTRGCGRPTGRRPAGSPLPQRAPHVPQERQASTRRAGRRRSSRSG